MVRAYRAKHMAVRTRIWPCFFRRATDADVANHGGARRVNSGRAAVLFFPQRRYSGPCKTCPFVSESS